MASMTGIILLDINPCIPIDYRNIINVLLFGLYDLRPRMLGFGPSFLRELSYSISHTYA